MESELRQILDMVLDMRSKGQEPKIIVVDQDTLRRIEAQGRPFIPSFAVLNGDKSDTIYGIRVATVRGNKKHIEVI